MAADVDEAHLQVQRAGPGVAVVAVAAAGSVRVVGVAGVSVSMVIMRMQELVVVLGTRGEMGSPELRPLPRVGYPSMDFVRASNIR